MSIFCEVKEYVTARQAAESYGLQVRGNGLACCPFHNDRHPSMKIDKNYHCFACGASTMFSAYLDCHSMRRHQPCRALGERLTSDTTCQK